MTVIHPIKALFSDPKMQSPLNPIKSISYTPYSIYPSLRSYRPPSSIPLSSPSHPEGLLSGMVVCVSSVPGPSRPLPQAVAEQVDEEESIVLRGQALPPKLYHQHPESVPWAAHVHHWRRRDIEERMYQRHIYQWNLPMCYGLWFTVEFTNVLCVLNLGNHWTELNWTELNYVGIKSCSTCSTPGKSFDPCGTVCEQLQRVDRKQ